MRARGTQGVGRGMRSLRGLARRRPTGLEWRVRGKDELACVGLKLLSRSTHANARTRSERGRVRRVERLVCARSLFARARFVSFPVKRHRRRARGEPGHTGHTGTRITQANLTTTPTHNAPARPRDDRGMRGPRADSTAAAPVPTAPRGRLRKGRYLDVSMYTVNH